MKDVIKNNIIGFIIGAFVFGGIGIVVATTIASSTVTYSNSENVNVGTVEDALDDLYNKAHNYIDPSIISEKISYRYWNDSFQYNTYNNSSLPVTNYESRALLEQNYGSSNFAARPYYIKSILIDGNVVGHQACLYIKNTEFCVGPNYWDTDLATTRTKLRTDMGNTYGVNVDFCENSSAVWCGYTSPGTFFCLIGSGGNVYCGANDANRCDALPTGASCRTS